MSRGKKVLLLLATAWPVLYMLVFMVFWFTAFASIVSQSSAPDIDRVLGTLVPLHLFTMLEGFALIALYVYLAYKKAGLDESQRLLWILIVALTGFVGQLIFFFAKVWPDPSPALSGTPPEGR